MTSIDDLPSNLLAEEILNRIPIRDAVRTSILSTHWRYRWRSIPDLSLDDLSVAAIDRVVLLHSSARSFSVSSYDMTISDSNQWLLSLSPSSLFSLRLSFLSQRQQPCPLHSSLFSFRFLQYLGLDNCSIPNSSSFFPLLRTLRLIHVTFPDDQWIHCLISNSPNLMDLKLLENTPSPLNLTIANPNLRSFSFSAQECNSIIFAAAQALDYVELQLSRDTVNFDLSQCFPVGAACNGTLCLGSGTVEGLTNRKIPKSIPDGFQNLTFLHTRIDFARAEQIMLLLCIMRSAPNLQKLKSSGTCGDKRISLGKDFWKQHTMGQLSNLQTVELHLFSYLVGAMINFVLAVLEKASRLEKLIICDYHSSSSGSSTLEMLTNYKRASPQAKIILASRKLT